MAWFFDERAPERYCIIIIVIFIINIIIININIIIIFFAPASTKPAG